MLKNLKKLREERKLTQKQLAEVILVSQQSINKYENHGVEPDIATVIRLADYFSVSVDYLIGRTTVRDRAARRLCAEQGRGRCAPALPLSDAAPKAEH